MKVIDSHAHLNFKGYDDDREAVISRIQTAALRVIVPSSQYQTSCQAVELARQYDFLYAAIGQHPIHVFDEPFEVARYEELIAAGGVIAIGETGLDYFHIKQPERTFTDVQASQAELFRVQIQLALTHSLPVIVHGRASKAHPEAYFDINEILRQEKVTQAVIHCFTGSLEEAEVFLQAGYYLGFTGIITFDKSGSLTRVVKQAPLESILIETDAPYLSPQPYRGKRNEPLYVIEVARAIAQIKGLTLEAVVRQTTTNAEQLFHI